jgi:putative transposase
MSKTKSWEITDDFWSRVEPLIPVRERPGDQSYSRAAGGGRRRWPQTQRRQGGV